MRDGSECTARRRRGPRIANVSAQQLLLPHSLRLRHVDLDPPRQRMQNTPCSKAASCLQVTWGQASGLAVFMPGNSSIPNRREQECISKQRRRCGLLHLCDTVSTGPVPRLCPAQKHQAPDAAGDATQQEPKGWGGGGVLGSVVQSEPGGSVLKSTSCRTLNFSRLCRRQNKHEGTERNQRGLWVENSE